MNKPDIVSVIENEGVEIKQRGKAFWASCPFHAEKTPSFKIDPERQTFYCFGCHEHGDIIDFIQKYRGMSFKNALQYLGIATDRPSSGALHTIKEKQKKRGLVKQFRMWEAHHHSEICFLYRTLQKIKSEIKAEADLDEIARIYHLETMWLYELEILESRDDATKFQLYVEGK
jgi:DNA primase